MHRSALTRLRSWWLAGAAALAGGCSQVPALPAIPTLTPYKMDVQQGNVVTQEMVEKLKPGMTPAQVRFILGTPLVVDAFHKDRWDYVYRFSKAGTLQESRRIVIVFQDDKLARIEGDVVPARPGSATEGGVTIAPGAGKPIGTKPAAEKAVGAKPSQEKAVPEVASPGPETVKQGSATDSSATAAPGSGVPADAQPVAEKNAPEVASPNPEAAQSGAVPAEASASGAASSGPASDAASAKADKPSADKSKQEKPKDERGFFGKMLDKLGF